MHIVNNQVVAVQYKFCFHMWQIDLVQLSGYCGMKADVSNDADNVKQ
jgi:hypothetical protein